MDLKRRGVSQKTHNNKVASFSDGQQNQSVRSERGGLSYPFFVVLQPLYLVSRGKEWGARKSDEKRRLTIPFSVNACLAGQPLFLSHITVRFKVWIRFTVICFTVDIQRQTVRLCQRSVGQKTLCLQWEGTTQMWNLWKRLAQRCGPSPWKVKSHLRFELLVIVTRRSFLKIPVEFSDRIFLSSILDCKPLQVP